MIPSEWEGLISESTKAVQEKVSELAGKPDRGATVGVGASGDRTIVADRVAEDELLKTLNSIDGVRVLSEEAGWVGGDDDGILAVVDPLDGSSNFVRGIPFYCTSVALSEGDTLADIKLGVIRDLVTGDLFVGRKGKGSTKNGRSIELRGPSKLSECVAGIDMSKGSEEMVASLAPLVSRVKRQVHLGANALELCYLADGRIDAFVDLRGRMRVTDFAAAYLIAVEAGARFSSEDGSELRVPFDLGGRFSFAAASNQTLHSEIIMVLRESRAKG